MRNYAKETAARVEYIRAYLRESGARGIVSVSYTHLDEYKRQVFTPARRRRYRAGNTGPFGR